MSLCVGAVCSSAKCNDVNLSRNNLYFIGHGDLMTADQRLVYISL